MNKLHKTLLCKTSFGDSMEVFENDWISREIIEHGMFEQYELTILSTLFSLMPSRRVSIDIGSNIGNHCGLFSRYFQETHAIEANPDVCAVLSRNIERNDWKAKAHNIGFSDRSGILPLFINEDGNLGATTFREGKHSGRSVNVEITTGDDFVQKNISETIDFIKIDVESFEGPVIKGLSKTIERFQPIISMEWNNLETVSFFNEHSIFENELNMYQKFTKRRRWDFNLWPGILGKVRRKINKMFAKKGHHYYITTFNINEFSDMVILIPNKHADIIARLYAAHPLISI